MFLGVGTGDGEISVWNAARTEPICRITTTKDNRILDLDWFDHGKLLFACGSNGLIYFVVFDNPLNQISEIDFASKILQVILFFLTLFQE